MRCERCGGLKLDERFYGVDDSVGVWSFDGFRCINCGGVWFAEPAAPTCREPALCSGDDL